MSLDPRLSIAPMMDCTTRHFRYLMRLISRHVVLYTEMVNQNAIILGDPTRHLAFDPSEQPLVLQLGGSEPHALAKASEIAKDFGYAEINLNIGCPSERVQSGSFGACLMREPKRVLECASEIKAKTNLPVTIKTRIGVDHDDSYEFLHTFVSIVSECADTFIIHARKAWLKGLSPKQNREIPPLQYDVVSRLKSDFPDKTIIINGGIKNLQSAKSQFQHLDGVMIGREAYTNPYAFSTVDAEFYGDFHRVPTREAVWAEYEKYICKQLKQGERLSALIRPAMGLFYGVGGARDWRRFLNEVNFAN